MYFPLFERLLKKELSNNESKQLQEDLREKIYSQAENENNEKAQA